MGLPVFTLKAASLFCFKGLKFGIPSWDIMAELLPCPIYLTPPATALLLFRPLPPKIEEELLVPSLLFIII